MVQSPIIRAASLAFLGSVALFSAALAAETTDVLVEKARKLDRALDAAPALDLYRQAEAQDPKRVDVLVGAARQYRHLMADATSSSEKLRLLGLAQSYSQRAVQIDPESAEAHLSLAITYAKRFALEGRKQQVTTSRLLRSELDNTLRLAPKSDLAWYLLGRWCEGYAELSPTRRTMGEMLYGPLPKATYEEAIRCFQKSIALNPNRLMNYIELGRIYGLMGRTEEARTLLKKGLAMPNREKDDPDSKKRGNEALATLH